MAVSVIRTDGHELRICLMKGGHEQTDLDSHADTCVAGSNCILGEETGETANVYTFTNERKPLMSIPIGTCYTAWTCQETGETFILVLNETLYFGKKLMKTLL